MNNQIVLKIAEHEKIISELYDAFGKYLPNHKFWLQLAEEEINHENIIKDFFIGDELIYVNENRFNVQAIDFSIKHIKERLEEAKNEKIGLEHALGISLDFENSLLEKKFFEIYEGDTVDFKKFALNMQESINNHIKRIKNEMEETKNNDS